MPDFHRFIKTEYDISGLDRSIIDGHPQLGLLTADTGAGKISNLQQNLERNQETQAYRLNYQDIQFQLNIHLQLHLLLVSLYPMFPLYLIVVLNKNLWAKCSPHP